MLLLVVVCMCVLTYFYNNYKHVARLLKQTELVVQLCSWLGAVFVWLFKLSLVLFRAGTSILEACVPRLRCWAWLRGWKQQISPWELPLLAKGRGPIGVSTYSFSSGSRKGDRRWRLWNPERKLKGKGDGSGRRQETAPSLILEPLFVKSWK